MKKLALALVCMFSVAFFASCVDPIEHPEPTIGFAEGEEFISANAEITTGEAAWFCIQAKANVQTNKLLKSFYFQIYSGETRYYDTLINDINLAEYEFVTGFQFLDAGTYTVSASTTDADNLAAECRLELVVNASLTSTPINWVKTGSNVEETTKEQLESAGLQWTGSFKEIFATIKPTEGTQLYVRSGDDYASLLTEQQMADYYNSIFETTEPNESYRNITTNNDADYNDMLFTKTADGNYHAVKISHADIETGSYGTQITITGEMK